MVAQVTINNGPLIEINIPRNVKNRYERVEQYGIAALQERILRTRMAKKAKANGDVFQIRSIEYRGDVITQW
jgi:hypothetical protein